MINDETSPIKLLNSHHEIRHPCSTLNGGTYFFHSNIRQFISVWIIEKVIIWKYHSKLHFLKCNEHSYLYSLRQLFYLRRQL